MKRRRVNRIKLTFAPTSTLTSRTFPGMGAPTWPLIDFWAFGWNFISCVGGAERYRSGPSLLTCRHLSFCSSHPSFIIVTSVYLHGNSVFNQHRSQLSVQLKEDLSLAGLVQVTQSQGLDVEGLPPLQLHLGSDKRREDGGERGNWRGRMRQEY